MVSKGFLVEAYNVADPTGPIIGTFSSVSDGKLLACRSNGSGPDVTMKNLNQLSIEFTSHICPV